jgi:cyclopropane-fatty-acyl-phospholipid synthase
MIPHIDAARPSERAARVLRQVFAAVRGDFAFRLWDGTTVAFGAGPPAFTVVIRAPETFFRLMRDPTPLAFGEAYVDSALDIEGDLFAAMHVANALEDLRLPLAQRLRLLLSMGPAALRPGPRRKNGSA